MLVPHTRICHLVGLYFVELYTSTAIISRKPGSDVCAIIKYLFVCAVIKHLFAITARATRNLLANVAQFQRYI